MSGNSKDVKNSAVFPVFERRKVKAAKEIAEVSSDGSIRQNVGQMEMTSPENSGNLGIFL